MPSILHSIERALEGVFGLQRRTQLHGEVKAKRFRGSCHPRLVPLCRIGAWVLFIIATTIVLTTSQALGQADVVLSGNGDRLTGEVKRLRRGKLSFKTQATDTIEIKWDEIAYMSSAQRLEIELQDGKRFLGSLIAAQQEMVLRIATEDRTVDIPMPEVVQITPIETTFREQIDGEISVGYSFAKASDVSQFSIALAAEHRREQRITQLNLNTVVTSSEDNETTERENLDFRYIRLLPERWLAGGVVLLERNDGIGVDLRTSIGGVAGRFIRQTNQSRIVALAGLVVSQERPVDLATEETLEGMLALNMEWFGYDDPELDVAARLTVFPNFSDFGRVRANLDVDFRWEIAEDLFWGLSFYHSFDSEPLTVDAERTDYGIITSFGLEF